MHLDFASPIRSVVCLGAHPDDIEIGAAGTLLTIADRHPEARFHFAVATSTPERDEEARASAADLLGDRVTVDVFGFRDGFAPYDDPAAVKDEVITSAGGLAPDVVFCPYGGDAHQDHRFLSHIAYQVFRGPLILEYEIVKFDGDLGRPTVYLPLAEEFARGKLDHLARHFPSQHGKPWYTERTFDALMAIRGVESAAPSGSAEAFHCAKAVLG